VRSWGNRAEIRRQVTARADGLCEYCLVHNDHSVAGCEVDHIISVKHGGSSDLSNLAYACQECNRSKGSDIGSIASRPATFTRLFNPRLDRWSDHFRLELGVHIVGITGIGVATVRLLNLNGWKRVEEREMLRDVGLYPLPAARKRIKPAG
jgi:HNH endonuclease